MSKVCDCCDGFMSSKAMITPQYPGKEFCSDPCIDNYGDKKLSVLEQASKVCDARQKIYGSPKQNMRDIATMWSIIFGVVIPPEKVALAMIATKMCRLLESPDHQDSMVDIGGYLHVYEDCVKEDK